MSAQAPSPRETLKALAERFRLTKSTLRAIAQACDPSLGEDKAPDERHIASVNEAIEVFVLAGLDSDQLIARAISEQREQGGERWRETLWAGLLNAASAEWERRGRPERPLDAQLTTVPPIPPQPMEEIDERASGQNIAA
jgi:hypothetical protein